jgi:hypothetical protein
MSTTITPPNKADEFMREFAASIAAQMLIEVEPAIQQAMKDIEAKMRARARQCAIVTLDHSMEIHANREMLTIRIQQPERGLKA